MPLSSMTGFASVSGSDDTVRWSWELKSVNGRGLDVRIRLPTGYEALEAPAKAAVSAAFARGTVSALLSVQSEGSATRMALDHDALDRAIKISETVAERIRGRGVSVDGLLALRGVVVAEDPLEDDAAHAARQSAMLASLNTAVEELSEARASEGQALAGVIRDLLDTMTRLKQAIEDHPSRTPEAIATRLRASVTRLLNAIDGQTDLDPARLHQEAALLATRADIEEELKRLEAHLAAARELLAAEAPVGRRFDFLAQEFNREANTICSKSIDAQVSALGLDLKAVIDRLREQVQNVE